MITRPGLFTLLVRATRLRCPRCGKGKLFRGFFLMHPTCMTCKLTFEREAGFFLGAIYFNYGLTAVLASAAFIILSVNRVASNQTILWVSLTFTFVFPILLFRHARSFWLSFDQYIDPRPTEDSSERLS